MQLTRDFALRIKDTDITLITSEIFMDNPATQVQNLKVNTVYVSP
jgi:hypothetical protein